MTKLLRKTVFGLPSQEAMERIDASAKAARIREVGYRSRGYAGGLMR
jgi:hypothetical protein